jgi:hypothetical protein
MLTKRSSAIAIAILTAGATLALSTAPASAGGGGGGGKQKSTTRIRITTTTPGTAPTGGHGGGGGSGKAAQMPCPAGAVCGQTTLGAAAPLTALPATEVAMEARAALDPSPPVVHTAPANRTYVQLRTGLWVDGFTELQQPLTLGGTTVILYAHPRYVTWHMGESTITCQTPGSRNGKTCGYTYGRSSASQPNRTYRISATITWDVEWTCTGGFCDAPGGNWGADSTESRTTEADLAVGEVQTESRPG